MKWILLVGFLFLLCFPLYGEEMYEISESELNALEDQIEKDAETIERLTAEKIELLKEIAVKDIRIYNLENQLGRSSGIYLGGGLAYPLGFDAYGTYMWHKWGIILRGGYSNGFSVGLGAVIKMK